MPSKICLASWISRSVTSSITPDPDAVGSSSSRSFGLRDITVRALLRRKSSPLVRLSARLMPPSAHPAIRTAASRQPPSRFPAIAARHATASLRCLARGGQRKLIQHRHHLIVRGSAGSRQDEIERDDRACSARRALLPLMSKRPQIAYDAMSLYFRLTLRYAGRIEASR